MVNQAMNTGNANIVNLVDLVTHHFRSHPSFFGNRDVARTGAHDGDFALAAQLTILPEPNRAGRRKMLTAGKGAQHMFSRFGRRSRNQNIVGTSEQRSRNRDNLIRRLTETKNDFGHSVPQSPVMVDFGESEIFEWHVTNAREGVVNSRGAGLDLFEQRSQLFFTHADNHVSK